MRDTQTFLLLNSIPIYTSTPFTCPKSSFRWYFLELLRAMHEVVRIRLRNYSSLVRLLDKVLVSLLLSKVYGIVSRCKIQVRSLQVVRRRLPSHQRILPSVSLLQYVPIHAPVMTMPVSRLRGCFSRPVYSVAVDISFCACCHHGKSPTELFVLAGLLELRTIPRQELSLLLRYHP